MAETPSPTPNAAEVEEEKQEKLKKEYLKLRGHYSVQAHKALMDSFVLYDVVFDIRLLYDLERGWIIRGRENVAPESMTAIGGRAIACCGEHDAGKTHFFKNLLNIQLAPGLSISTMGISIVAPKNDSASSAGDVAGSSIQSVRMNNRQKSFHDYLVIDVAGSDVAVPDLLTKEQRTTEIFLRRLALDLSCDIIFVCTKFNHIASETIKALYEQRGNAKYRLWVVHNLVAAMAPEDLEFKINELNKLYLEDEIDTVTRPNGAIFYDTSKYRHVFLVNDKAISGDDANWGAKHNAMMFDAIRASLLEIDQGKPKNFAQELVSVANKHLRDFIVGWNDWKLEIRTITVEGEDQRAIVAVRKDDGSLPTKPFDLQPLAFFEGGHYIKESDIQLRGSFKVETENNKKFLFFSVETPGLSSDSARQKECNFRIGVDEINGKVSVKYNTSFLRPAASIGGNRRFGECIFTIKPKGVLEAEQARLKNLGKDGRHLTLENGLLSFRVGLESAVEEDGFDD